ESATFHFDDVAKHRRSENDELRQLRSVIAMVVEHPEGLAWPDRVTIEVSKHLLTPLESLVQEENDGDALVCQVRLLPQCRLDGSPAVLAVVDYKSGSHRHV